MQSACAKSCLHKACLHKACLHKACLCKALPAQSSLSGGVSGQPSCPAFTPPYPAGLQILRMSASIFFMACTYPHPPGSPHGDPQRWI